MSYRAIRFEVSGRVAVITLDRPEVRNAFNGAMGRELASPRPTHAATPTTAWVPSW